ILAAGHDDPADLLVRLRLKPLLAGLLGELEALLEERLRLGKVTLPERGKPGREVGLRQHRRAHAGRLAERFCQPAATLAHQAADAPEADEGARKLQAQLDLARLERPGERGTD